jgi:hypothetical protein
MVKGSSEVAVRGEMMMMRAVEVGGACAVFLEISSWGQHFWKRFFPHPSTRAIKGLVH